MGYFREAQKSWRFCQVRAKFKREKHDFVMEIFFGLWEWTNLVFEGWLQISRAAGRWIGKIMRRVGVNIQIAKDILAQCRSKRIMRFPSLKESKVGIVTSGEGVDASGSRFWVHDQWSESILYFIHIDRKAHCSRPRLMFIIIIMIHSSECEWLVSLDPPQSIGYSCRRDELQISRKISARYRGMVWLVGSPLVLMRPSLSDHLLESPSPKLTISHCSTYVPTALPRSWYQRPWHLVGVHSGRAYNQSWVEFLEHPQKYFGSPIDCQGRHWLPGAWLVVRRVCFAPLHAEPRQGIWVSSESWRARFLLPFGNQIFIPMGSLGSPQCPSASSPTSSRVSRHNPTARESRKKWSVSSKIAKRAEVSKELSQHQDKTTATTLPTPTSPWTHQSACFGHWYRP